IERVRVPCYIGVAVGIDSDSRPHVTIAAARAAEVRGIDERRSICVQFCHKSVSATGVGSLNRVLSRKGTRSSTRNVSIPRAIDGDAGAIAAYTKEGG